MFLAGQLVHPAPEKSMWIRGWPPMVVSEAVSQPNVIA
jgi:hypothetical protein